MPLLVELRDIMNEKHLNHTIDTCKNITDLKELIQSGVINKL
jgi:hypothetical protein